MSLPRRAMRAAQVLFVVDSDDHEFPLTDRRSFFEIRCIHCCRSQFTHHRVLTKRTNERRRE